MSMSDHQSGLQLTTSTKEAVLQPGLEWTTSMKEMVLQRLHQFQQQGLLCDVTVLAMDGQSQPAHAVILAAASPVFQRHISACQHGTYWIKTDLTAEQLQALVYFVYTGQLLMGVDMEACLTSFQLWPKEDDNHNVIQADQWAASIWEQLQPFQQQRFLCDVTVVDSRDVTVADSHGISDVTVADSRDVTVVDSQSWHSIPLHGCILGALSPLLCRQLQHATCWPSHVVIELDSDVTSSDVTTLQQLVSNLYDSVDLPGDFDAVCPWLGIDSNTLTVSSLGFDLSLSQSQRQNSSLTFLEDIAYSVSAIKPEFPLDGDKTSCYMYDLAFPGDIAPVVSAVYHKRARVPTCKLCGETFKQKSEMMKHKRQVHPSTYKKKHQCQHCSQTFYCKRDCTVHEHRHLGIRPYKCHFCERSYVCKSHVKRHERNHTGIKPAVCGVCFSSFNTSHEMAYHARIHTGERPYACQHCDRTFYASGSLARHVLTHTGVKEFMCHLCGKVFASRSELRVHSRTHTKDKPYPCQFCQKSFRSSAHARRHERLHTGETPYTCAVCDKAFTSSSNLRSHETSHREERPYKCSYCDKGFKLSRYVTEHERTHTGARPFKCRLCEKKFTASGARSRHEKSHTGEKPYSCSKCQKAFSTRAHVRRHETTCKR